MIWVNIDVPARRYTIHESSVCRYVLRKKRSLLHSLDWLTRDGGWLSFDSMANALARQQKQYPDFDVVEHC